MKKGLLILFLLIGILHRSNSQSIESVNELNTKAEHYLNINPDSASIIAQKAIELSTSIEYIDGKSEGLSILGFSSYIKGEYADAKKYCTESIKIGEQSNRKKGPILAYHALGLVYINQGKNDEAIKTYSSLVEMASAENDLFSFADACSNLGLAYLNKKYYQRSREWFLSAINIYKKIEHPQGEVFAQLNYGRLFFEQNEYDSALYYLNISSTIARQIKNERAILHVNSILGQINLSIGKLDESLQLFTDAYIIAENLDLLWEKANLSSWLCEAFYKKQDFNNAIYYGKIAIELAKEANIIYILQKVNNILAKSHLETNDYEAAENHLTYLEHLIDSLALIDSADLMSTIIDQGVFKEEEQNMKFVSNQLAIAKAEISRRNILLIGALLASFLLLAILVLIINSNRDKTKTNKELLALNEKIKAQKEHLEDSNKALDTSNGEKDLLLSMVAHDIRSPLNKISGLVNILQLENGLNNSQNEVYSMVQQTIKDANKLADELLEINKIESGMIAKTEDKLMLSEFIQQLIEQYHPIADEKGIKIELEQNCPDIAFTSDRKILQRIFENLVSNAVKFSEKNSAVTIKLECTNEKIIFNVIDKGQGIPEEEHKYLFTKFGKTSTRPTNGESSNGLGLYIVDQLTKTLGGQLNFQSKVGEGSRFAVSLPV